jgi:hypothetical protein
VGCYHFAGNRPDGGWHEDTKYSVKTTGLDPGGWIFKLDGDDLLIRHKQSPGFWSSTPRSNIAYALLPVEPPADQVAVKKAS